MVKQQKSANESEQQVIKPKKIYPRLQAKERAKLIEEFKNDMELSNPDYYVIKDKNDKYNVRRKKDASSSNDESQEPIKKVNEIDDESTVKPKEHKPKAL